MLAEGMDVGSPLEGAAVDSRSESIVKDKGYNESIVWQILIHKSSLSFYFFLLIKKKVMCMMMSCG